MRRSGFIIAVLMLVVIVLSVTQAVVSNRLSTSGVLINKIEEEIDHYKTQNAVLSEQLLSISSLTNLASKATELGFVKEKQQFVLSKSLPLAIRQRP